MQIPYCDNWPYLIVKEGQSAHPAIQSLDSRAADIIDISATALMGTELKPEE